MLFMLGLLTRVDLIVTIKMPLCRYGTFATGVCDGCVNVWDGNN